MRQQREARFGLECHPDGQRREHAVHQESDESVEQQKSVVLQQNEQRQRDPRVVQRRFARPRFDIVRRFEMHERNRKKKQHHRARQPWAAAICFPASASCTTETW